MPRQLTMPRARRGLLLAAIAAVVPFAPAQAQLGRMIKKAAQGAVEGAVQGKAAEATGGTTESRSGGRGESLVPITTENLDALLAALAPSVEAATAYENARVAHEAGSAKLEKHRTCRDSVKKAFGGTLMPSGSAMTAQVEYGTKVSEIMQRMAAAQQAGDAKRSRMLLDSVGVMGEDMENSMLPSLKKCGPYVPEPGEYPKSPDLGPPKIPTGMSATQFGRLRERVAAWLLTDGKYKVNDDERGALEGRKQQLGPLGPLFKGSALQWSNWSDLTTK